MSLLATGTARITLSVLFVISASCQFGALELTFSEHLSHSEQYVLPLAVDVGIRLPLDLFSVLVSSILLGRLVESLKQELFMVIFIAVFGMGGVS